MRRCRFVFVYAWERIAKLKLYAIAILLFLIISPWGSSGGILNWGQNLFSGGPYPLSPTENDIAQWTWTSIINDAEKVVYWILNNRSQGNETNEWSMLDFKSRPNERLIAAGRIAKVINKNKALFSNAKNKIKA